MDFAIDVAIDEYVNHLPLDRQRRMMGRAGLVIDTQTLWDQIDGLARHLEPTYTVADPVVVQPHREGRRPACAGVRGDAGEQDLEFPERTIGGDLDHERLGHRSRVWMPRMPTMPT